MKARMLSDETILEQLCEAMKLTRRYGTHRAPKFPNILEVSRILWNTEHSRIELEIMDNGQLRKFDLLLIEVEEHGEHLINDAVTVPTG